MILNKKFKFITHRIIIIKKMTMKSLNSKINLATNNNIAKNTKMITNINKRTNIIKMSPNLNYMKTFNPSVNQTEGEIKIEGNQDNQITIIILINTIKMNINKANRK
jgi:hypothetical protein